MAAVRVLGGIPTVRNAEGQQIAASSSVHHMPCKIKLDGPAKVDTFFVPSTLLDGKKEVAFRGRRLEGHTLDLRSRGMVGVVYSEATDPTEADLLPNTTPSSDASTTLAAAPAAGAGRGAAAAVPGRAQPAARGGGAAGRGRGGRGYGAASRGYGFGGYAVKTSAADDDDDDDDEEEESYAMDFGQEEESEEDGEGASTAGRGAAATSAGAAAAADGFGRCCMRTWTADRVFESATYWLHDKAAGDFDMLQVAADWFDLAQRVHDPVSSAELQEAAALMAGPSGPATC